MVKTKISTKPVRNQPTRTARAQTLTTSGSIAQKAPRKQFTTKDPSAKALRKVGVSSLDHSGDESEEDGNVQPSTSGRNKSGKQASYGKQPRNRQSPRNTSLSKVCSFS